MQQKSNNYYNNNNHQSIRLLLLLIMISIFSGNSFRVLLRNQQPKTWLNLHRTKYRLRPTDTSVASSYANDAIVSQLKNNDPDNNISESILSKIGRNLHLQKNHPLNIIKTKIETYCNDYAKTNGQGSFEIYDNLNPIVSTKNCFDDLRVEPTHVSRRPSDTYYVNKNTVLRTHTSAHQTQFISQGVEAFLCSGDVYRRDEIDASHYPVFHQMEGVRIFPKDIKEFQGKSKEEIVQYIENDLKGILTGLAKHLFGDVPMRWNSEYFPFTDPSFELEVQFNGKWLEVLGCGVIHKDVLNNSQRGLDYGWAFGLGLERLAMVLFDIPDIRIFWSSDERFLKQFEDGKVKKFIPYSKHPVCYKDVSFWLPKNTEDPTADPFHPNDVYELIREIAGDLAEQVELFDQFTNPKTGKRSQAYRIYYRSMDRSLTNEEVDQIQWNVRDTLVKELNVQLR